VPLSHIANRYDQFILDLDGCVWIGDEPTPRAVEAIEALREGGKEVAYATNDPRSATEDYVTRLWKIGIRASVRDVVTVGGATQHLLAETRSGRTAFVVGTEALKRHVTDAGLRVLNGTDLASRAEVVVVGGTEDLVYDDLRQAALAVRRGAEFLATARDPTYPQPDGLWPGTGAILAAVEVASGRTAAIVGKPEPQLMLTALGAAHAGGGRPRGHGPDRGGGREAGRGSGAQRWDRTTGTERVRARADSGDRHARRPDPGLKSAGGRESERKAQRFCAT
jgi:HAD superfamily hydrolase (TIGR01450 family)